MNEDAREDIRENFQRINKAKEAIRLAEESAAVEHQKLQIENSERYRQERAAIANYRNNRLQHIGNNLPAKPKVIGRDQRPISDLPLLSGKFPPVPPSEKEKKRCPLCKIEIADDAFGRLSEPTWRGNKDIPCPECSPPVLARQARKKMILLRQQFFGGYNIPARMSEYNFENYPGPAFIKEQSLLYLAGVIQAKLKQRYGFYIGGLAGVGKTSLCIAMVREMEAQGFISLFLPVAQLFEKLYEGINPSSGFTKDDVMWLLSHIEFLVCDDLGTEAKRDFVLRELGIILNARLDARLPTAFTSNLTIDDQDTAWRQMTRDGLSLPGFHEGQRLTDRLHEYCNEFPIKGPNLRKK